MNPLLPVMMTRFCGSIALTPQSSSLLRRRLIGLLEGFDCHPAREKHRNLLYIIPAWRAEAADHFFFFPACYLPPILWTPDYAAWRSACSGVIYPRVE
jgi:hypothetical protein